MPLLPTEVIQADPTKPLDPNFPADKLPEVKILFQQRLEGILKNSNSDVVKDFFTQYVAEHNKAYDRVPIPSFTSAATSTIDYTSESLSHHHLFRAIEELRKREVELENELSTTRAKRRRLEEVLE
ncbi:unnamed protein product [Umbelopsis vinacea]